MTTHSPARLPAAELETIELARSSAVSQLLARRGPEGHWEGRLSSSALSTATACMALRLHAQAVGGGDSSLVRGGLDWLVANQNEDGGFGDTVDSPSNLSTTLLVWVALGLAPDFTTDESAAVSRCEGWLRDRVGELEPRRIARAVRDVYGADKTFAVPILVTCALGGRFGKGPRAWRSVPALPFELAALPHGLFHLLGLPMVSYAMPALIAIGQVIAAHKWNFNPLTKLTRTLLTGRTLRVLESIQPENGGFLEATPLTSFVCASLVASGRAEHPVVERGLAFLRHSARTDGSWPIDTNLALWVTSLAVDALSGAGQQEVYFTSPERSSLAGWYEENQYVTQHPYTHAAPGGWAWTDLPGGVPDADDTPGALIALARLGSGSADRAEKGLGWLAGLQNRDGGMPTFCKGWGKLPFDRSCPDLAAHALRAIAAWDAALPGGAQRRFDLVRLATVDYLLASQAPDGSWDPLWFGNQCGPEQKNPLYGTSRVLKAGGAFPGRTGSAGAPVPETVAAWREAIEKGVRWVLAAQHPGTGERGGGFGGAPGVVPSLEETGLALDGLASVVLAARSGEFALGEELYESILDGLVRGALWLARATEGGERFDAAPIGLYFAKLWYSEELYPLIFTVAALERTMAVLEGGTP